MNVRDTSSHSDTSMCQIWSANVNKKKVMGRHESAQTDRQTDRRTNRMISIYPPELHSYGYNKKNKDLKEI